MFHIDGRSGNLDIRKNNFISKSNEKYNNKYDYKNIIYINNDKCVDIVCPEHGIFRQSPSNHLKHGCVKCNKEIKLNFNFNNFLSKSGITHNYKYFYIKETFLNIKNDVFIICPDHGFFKQNAYRHSRGSKCPKCDIIYRAKSSRLLQSEAIRKLIDKHGDRYDYSLVEYVDYKSNINIICKRHGVFSQKYSVHYMGHGCSLCNMSNGELRISEYLDNMSFLYIKEHTFDDCKYINKLRYDFYIKDLNLCIEYDGIQHFKSIEYFGGDKKLRYQKKWIRLNQTGVLKIT